MRQKKINHFFNSLPNLKLAEKLWNLNFKIFEDVQAKMEMNDAFKRGGKFSFFAWSLFYVKEPQNQMIRLHKNFMG